MSVDQRAALREFDIVAAQCAKTLGYNGPNPTSFWFSCIAKFIALKTGVAPDEITNIGIWSADLCAYFAENGTDGFRAEQL